MPRNHEQISVALDLLTQGLSPYVERKLKANVQRQLDAGGLWQLSRRPRPLG